MKLTKRLEKIASYIEEGAILADVGTDHGYIPIKLALEGKIQKAYAMDINSEPLNKAKQNINKHGVEEKVHTILSDGLTHLKDDAVDTVVIAGMGGLLIVHILKEGAGFLEKGRRLILSPHGDSQYVRQEIHKQGYAIIEENFIEEEEKYYPIIICQKGIEENYSEKDYYYGKKLIESKNQVLCKFLCEESVRLHNILQHLKEHDDHDQNEQSRKSLRLRISEIEQEINMINEVITCLLN